MDDIQDFFRLTLDTSDLDLDGEVDLYNYRPETKDVEDSTVLDVLKVAEMTIKLLDAIKLHFRLDILDKQEHTIIWFVKRYKIMTRYKLVSSQLGGEDKMEQLKNIAKEVKKIAVRSLRKSLSEVLPVSLEDHILDNILTHINPLEEEAKGLETMEEDKPILSSLYYHLTHIYSKIRTNLYRPNSLLESLTPELIDPLPLQEILSELKTADNTGTDEETTEETEQEGEAGENVIMGGKEVELEDNDEVKKGNDDKEEEKEL